MNHFKYRRIYFEEFLAEKKSLQFKDTSASLGVN